MSSVNSAVFYDWINYLAFIIDKNRSTQPQPIKERHQLTDTFNFVNLTKYCFLWDQECHTNHFSYRIIFPATIFFYSIPTLQ